MADAVGYEGKGFDLIAFFDCLHDMADPISVSRHARKAISDDGTAMIVEPFANDRVRDNLNPVGRVMYGASTQICVPVSLARKGPALGAQAGEARLPGPRPMLKWWLTTICRAWSSASCGPKWSRGLARTP